MADRYDSIYLAPHFDDVALSCGGRIAEATRLGERVLVVTLTGGTPPHGLSRFARSMLRSWGFESGAAAVETRRREDQTACSLLGAEVLHWDILECIYRCDPASGVWLYPTGRKLFGPPAPCEEALRAEIERRLATLPPHQRLFAPLAIGHHVDHVVTREAAERHNDPALAFYEDFPYLLKWRAARRARGGGDWVSEVTALSAWALERKVDAIAAYASQLENLFGNRAELERLVRRAARKCGGERLWRRAEVRTAARRA